MAISATGFMSSTIAQKYLVAVSAIIWSVFVMVHMLGNIFIFFGAEPYNKYSHSLTNNLIIYAIEVILLISILIHVFTAISLKIRNTKANPLPYLVKGIVPKANPLPAITMVYTGSIVLVFLIWHLTTFKFGQNYVVAYDGIVMRDLYRLVLEHFQKGWYVILYCISLVFLGVHLFHGIRSVFHSLGISHPRYDNFIKWFGYIYSFAVSIGFISQPLYVYLMRF